MQGFSKVLNLEKIGCRNFVSDKRLAFRWGFNRRNQHNTKGKEFATYLFLTTSYTRIVYLEKKNTYKVWSWLYAVAETHSIQISTCIYVFSIATNHTCIAISQSHKKKSYLHWKYAALILYRNSCNWECYMFIMAVKNY